MKFNPKFDTLEDWHVRIYNDEDEIIKSWIVKDRTERHAVKEAMSEVEQHYRGFDWTLTPLD